METGRNRRRNALPPAARSATETRARTEAREASPRRRRGVRHRGSHVRLLRTALAVVLVTWLPGAIGGALHVSPLKSWGVASGYAGLSWAFPAFLIGLAVARTARDRGLPWQGAQGAAAGVVSAIVLVTGAASIVGA